MLNELQKNEIAEEESIKLLNDVSYGDDIPENQIDLNPIQHPSEVTRLSSIVVVLILLLTVGAFTGLVSYLGMSR